jgi:hypothetical protein
MKFVTKLFRRQDGLFLVVAAGVVTLYVAGTNGGFPLDDSWIHQVYGRNLGLHGEWAFVLGTPSAASTSPLYTILLALGYRLGISYMLWTHTLGIMALWIAAMTGARLAERLMPEQKRAGLWSGLAVALTWHLIWAAASGMETMLFSMWTLILITLAWRELDTRSSVIRHVMLRGLVFGVLAALATITRPEGIGLAGLIGLFLLITRPQGSWRTVMLWSISAVVGFLVFIAPYAVHNLTLTGGLLPDTAAAKQAEYASLLADSYPARIMNMLVPILIGGQLLLIPGAVYFVAVITKRLRENSRSALYLLPLLWAAAVIALYALRLPSPYQHGRYVISALPSLVITGMVGTSWLMRAGQKSLMGRVLTRSLVISTCIGYLYFAFVAGLAAYRQDVTIINQEMVAAAQWIAANVPPDQMLAVHDIGAVGYFAPRPILDLAGLVSPEIVPFIRDEKRLWEWLQQRNARYLMAFPDQIPGQDVKNPHLCLLYTTGGTASPAAGGPNMAVYALIWDGVCPAT